jgi:ActR/RegA family two-component response regulator
MLKALLLTRDQEVLRVIRRVLETVCIDLETVTSTEAAREIIARRKFDALMIDCDDVESGCNVIREVRKGKSNSKSIIFAVTNRVTTTKDAFAMGAHFALEKPISIDRTTRSLRAAHGLILRERKRYHRHQISATAHLTYGSVRDVPIPLKNISEGGLSLGMSRTADMQGAVHMRLELPGLNRVLEAKGEFVWTNETGHVGVRFTSLPTQAKSELESWLARQLEVSVPGLVGFSR